MTNDVRAHVHQMWNSVAAHWGEHAAYIDAKAESLTKVLLDNAALSSTDRVLELACGAGGLGGAAAMVAGSVVVSDVAPDMVAIAAQRVAGRSNVTAAVRDIEAIDDPDGCYDAVVCREGLMFAVDPSVAFGEAHRVLRRGGRLSAAVWGPQSENPWLGLVFDAVSAQLDRPMPPPGLPGPFALSDADALRGLAECAGFNDVRVEAFEVPTVAASFAEWWSRTSALAGPLANILAMLPDDAKAAIEQRLRVAVEPFEQSDGSLVFPGLALVLSAVA